MLVHTMRLFSAGIAIRTSCERPSPPEYVSPTSLTSIVNILNEDGLLGVRIPRCNPIGLPLSLLIASQKK